MSAGLDAERRFALSIRCASSLAGEEGLLEPEDLYSPIASLASRLTRRNGLVQLKEGHMLAFSPVASRLSL